MGSISIEQFLPAHLSRPDDASPIGTWEPPKNLTAMCVGFNPRADGAIVFEGETPIQFRLTERTWRYRYPGKSADLTITNRWRLEILAEPKRTHLRPEHSAVVAQEPYGTNWIQTAKFKMYSKKSESERPDTVVPQLNGKDHPVDWLERNLKHDLWEKGAHYIAGIGFPNGFQEEPRNTVGKFVFGACPDFERLVEEIFQTREVRDVLRRTEENQINFWYSGADIASPPLLYPEVIEEANTLMLRSIEQALGGPSESPTSNSKEWTGQPVSKLVRWIYCGHLNDCNKRIQRLLKHEGTAGDDIEKSKTRADGPDQFEGLMSNDVEQ